MGITTSCLFSLLTVFLALAKSSPTEITVYKPPGCNVLMRMQEIQAGQTEEQARVTRTQWNTNPESMARTIQNFFGGSENDPLWRRLDCQSLAYYGIIGNNHGIDARTVSCDDDDTLRTQPQTNLMNNDQNPVSFILPQGAKKLTFSSPDRHAVDPPLSESDLTATKGIVGISGTLDASDFAYANRAELIRAAKEYASAVNPCNANRMQVGGLITQDFVDVQIWQKAEFPSCRLLMVVRAVDSSGGPVLIAFEPGSLR